LFFDFSLVTSQLQAISKRHLPPNGRVASLFKMLTCSHVCCAFSSARALSLNVIYLFEMACNKIYTFFKFRRSLHKADGGTGLRKGIEEPRIQGFKGLIA